MTGVHQSFTGKIKSFKTNGGMVTINLIADSESLDLNKLNLISKDFLAVDLMCLQTELLPEEDQDSEENKAEK